MESVAPQIAQWEAEHVAVQEARLRQLDEEIVRVYTLLIMQYQCHVGPCTGAPGAGAAGDGLSAASAND